MSETVLAVIDEGLAKQDVAWELPERLRSLRDELLNGLVERDVAVRLALLGALAGEHLLLLGPPGTAKSLLARRLRHAFTGATYFERLLTRFSVPEELFGPLSIKGLEEDRYERLTDAYLPAASIAFLDEIFKANSAILNALLTLLNEREFDNGTRRLPVPLIAVIGASNELPEGDELEALFDRFLLRLHVDPVSTHGFAGLLALRDPAPVAGSSSFAVSRDELDALRATSAQVALPADVVAVLTDLRAWALAEKVAVSDRRWRKIVKLLQVSALTNDRSEVSIWDCWLLQHCVGDTVEHRRKVYDWYAARVGASAAMDPARLTRIVVAWEQKLKQDRDSRSQRRDANGALLYEGAGSKPSTEPKGLTRAQRGNEPLFLAPTNASADGYRLLRDRTDDGKGYTRAELSGLYVLREGFDHWHDREAYLAESSNWYHQNGALPALMEPTRFHQSYVADCSRQLADIARDVEAYDVRLDEHRTSLNEQIHRHLWVTPEFAVPALATLASTQKEVTVLRARVGSLQKGFDGLPRELDPTIAAAAVIPAATQPAVARVAAAAVTTRRSGS